jgi:hypothetical protein
MLRPLFEWMESLAVYGPSVYLGPGVNLVHLVSMVTFMGALLLVDLRLLGSGLTKQPVHQLARSARPWLRLGLIGLILTGIPALMATATQQYENRAFWMKMYILAFALVFTFTVRRKVVSSEDARIHPLLAKGVAAISIASWLTVAAYARLIMFL